MKAFRTLTGALLTSFTGRNSICRAPFPAYFLSTLALANSAAVQWAALAGDLRLIPFHRNSRASTTILLCNELGTLVDSRHGSDQGMVFKIAAIPIHSRKGTAC